MGICLPLCLGSAKREGGRETAEVGEILAVCQKEGRGIDFLLRIAEECVLRRNLIPDSLGFLRIGYGIAVLLLSLRMVY